MTSVQTVLWGGPLDGCEVNTEEPPKAEMIVGQFPGWSPYAEVPEVIRHHYVFDLTTRRYNYAGDWPR